MENVYINKIMIYGSNGRLLDVVRIAEFSNIKLMEERIKKAWKARAKKKYYSLV